MPAYMGLRSCFGVLLARAALLAYGYTLRGRELPGPPSVDGTTNDLRTDTAEQKISALKLKSVFAANSAQAAAAQANTATIHIEELYVKTRAVMPELDSIKAVAEKEATSAEKASTDTSEVYQAMEKQMSLVENDSKMLAVEKVKDLFDKKYHELSDWRNKVLTSPWDKGQVAAAKAAQPYFGAAGQVGGSQLVYGLESGAMKSQAASDAASAKSLEAGVEGKKEAGDPIGAAQDAEMAKALKLQSEQLAARAAAMDGQVANMGKLLPQWGGAAGGAAWNAEFAENPDSVPPPPVDPNFAFTPAPVEIPA